MVVIRCTQRLLKRSRVVPDPTPPEPSAVLGEWYANVMALPFRGESAVVFCNVETRIAVVTLGSTLRTTMPQFAQRLERLLERLGVPEDAIAQQRAEMVDGSITATNDRQMLTTLNDVTHMIRASAERFQSIHSLDLDDEEDALARTAHAASEVLPSIALATAFERAGFVMRPVEGVIHHGDGATRSAPGRSSTVPPSAHAPVPKRASDAHADAHADTDAHADAPVLVVATLTVRHAMLDRYRAYEDAAIGIMAKYGGHLERTIVEETGDSETLREIHEIRFPSRAAFDAYLAGPERAALGDEREAVIVSTDVSVTNSR